MANPACFQKAIAADPACAMAHWGVGYAAQPNYNVPWVRYDPAGRATALTTAYDATQAALALAATSAPGERALIEALPIRHP